MAIGDIGNSMKNMKAIFRDWLSLNPYYSIFPPFWLVPITSSDININDLKKCPYGSLYIVNLTHLTFDWMVRRNELLYNRNSKVNQKEPQVFTVRERSEPEQLRIKSVLIESFEKLY